MVTLLAPRRRAPESPANGVVLGIDQSYTNLAIVQLSGDGVFSPMVGHFKGKGDYTTAQDVLRLGDIEDWLAGVCTAWQDVPIGCICMEGYARGTSFQREESGELASIVRRSLLKELGRVPCIVNTMQLKKFVMGSTKAAKSDMKLHVYKRWNYETSDDNIADALGLSVIARSLCQGDEGLVAFQKEVLTALGSDSSWRLTREQLQQVAMLPAAKRGATLTSMTTTSSG